MKGNPAAELTSVLAALQGPDLCVQSGLVPRGFVLVYYSLIGQFVHDGSGFLIGRLSSVVIRAVDSSDDLLNRCSIGGTLAGVLFSSGFSLMSPFFGLGCIRHARYP